MSNKSAIEAQALVDAAQAALDGAEATLGGTGMACFGTVDEQNRVIGKAQAKRNAAADILMRVEVFRDQYGDFS